MQSDARKLVLNDIALEALVLGQNRLQQLPEGRYVPLAIAQVVDLAPERAIRKNLKIAVEGATRGYDFQVGIEHEQWLEHGVHDALRELSCIIHR